MDQIQAVNDAIDALEAERKKHLEDAREYQERMQFHRAWAKAIDAAIAGIGARLRGIGAAGHVVVASVSDYDAQHAPATKTPHERRFSAPGTTLAEQVNAQSDDYDGALQGKPSYLPPDAEAAE